MVLNDEKSDILLRIYYNIDNPAPFASQAKLMQEAKFENRDITLNDVKEWLQGQLVYGLHKDARRNFLRNRIVVSEIDEQWQADLVDLQEFKARNCGNGYILTIIDLFSKYAWAVPLINKGAKAVAAAFDKIFSESNRIPTKIQTDKKTEFLNRDVQEIFKKYGVQHFTAINPRTKCSAVERFNRTLKSKMFKYFTAQGTRKYIDVLPRLVNSYNNSVHSGTGKRPSWVKDSHKKEIMLKLYGVLTRRELLKKHYNRSKAVKSAKIKEGDTVRRSYELRTGFDKSYYPNWTDETYKVNRIINRTPRQVYRIADENGSLLEREFYPEEVQKVSADVSYRIEKVIKRRRRNGVIEFYVKYLGYPSSYNQWIPAANLQHLQNH